MIAEEPRTPSVVQKIHCGQLGLFTRTAPPHPVSPFNFCIAPTHPVFRFNSSISTHNPLLRPYKGLAGHGAVTSLPTMSPVFAAAPSEEQTSNTDLYLGSVPGAMCRTATAPIERVKLLIQNQTEMIKLSRLSVPYKGIGDCFARTIKDEGILALWRGNTAYVLRHLHYQVLSINFTALFDIMLNLNMEKDGYWKWFAGDMVSTGAAGVCALLTVYPYDYARTRLANDVKAAKMGGAHQFNGMFEAWRKALFSDGLAGLYRGFAISCVGVMLHRSLFFGMYFSLKPVVPTGSLKDNSLASFLLAWGTSTGAVLAAYPIDTVSRRMMMTTGEVVKYKYTLDAFSQILKNEGAKSLYKGAGTKLIHAVACAWMLFCYDKLLR